MNKKMYFSGYTRKNNKGISVIDFAEGKGILKSSFLEIIEEENPSYITLNDDKSMIFSVTSKYNGGVSLYKKIDDRYVLIDVVRDLGKAPCHLYFDERKNMVYASNYHLGKLDVLKLIQDDEYIYLSLLNTVKFHNKSILSPNQDSSKCHMAIKDRDDKFLVVVDLGGDIVYTYDINDCDKLKLISEYKTSLGMGPRHIEFSICGEYAYLLGELDSHIEVLSYDKNKGSFVLIERISMLPNDYTGENSGAAIKLSKDGRYLYSSNRGHDSIAVFEVMESGRLLMKEIKATGGKTPRDFGFDLSGEYLFVGHQDSESITVFNVDNRTGLLTRVEDYGINIPEITCIKS